MATFWIRDDYETTLTQPPAQPETPEQPDTETADKTEVENEQ
jgi:hypothetical protein